MNSFSEEKINNPDVQELMKKVEVRCDEDINNTFLKETDRWIHRLDVTMEDGTVYTKTVDYPIGDFNNPFDWQMLENKLYAITDGVLPLSTMEKLIANIKELDSMDDVNKMFENL